MLVDKDRVQNLLGAGLSPEIVANTVGCTPSYISQLMDDEAFAAIVTSKRSASLTGNISRDSSINSLEDRILEKLSAAVDTGGFYRPRDLLNAFTVVNRAVRRGPVQSGGDNTAKQTINLILPTITVERFTMSPNKEVIEIDNQTLITIPTSNLLSQLAKREGGEKYKAASNFIPNKTITVDSDG